MSVVVSALLHSNNNALGPAVQSAVIEGGVLAIAAGQALAGGEAERRKQQEEQRGDRLHGHSGVVALMPSIARRRSHWLGR